ncbi:MAG: DUF6282 family protein [Candidatus Bathyarchaeia archaeon]
MLDIEKKFLSGRCDIHIHTGPDSYFGVYASGAWTKPSTSIRLLDNIEAAMEAREAGMRAILLKCTSICTVDRAYSAHKVVPEVEVFGEINVNETIGGLNAAAIRRTTRIKPNLLRMVMLPANEPDPKRKDLLVTMKDGEPLPETVDVLNAIAEHDLILGCPAQAAMVRTARNIGVKKISIQHPEYLHVTGKFDLEKELVSLGAYLELCLNSCLPPNPKISYEEYANIIRAVGPQNCILVSDMGQIYNPTPVQGLRMLIVNMIQQGVSEEDIDTMTKTNPSYLLGLE